MRETFRRKIRCAMLVTLALGLLALMTGSAHAQWRATYLPTLEISRVQGEIDIDGAIDDPGWRAAAVATDFAEHSPGDQVQPPFRTVVYVTYDDRNFYVAFDCFDDDPSRIRASFCRRDKISPDDNVIIADLTETYLATALVAYQTSPVYGKVD